MKHHITFLMSSGLYPSAAAIERAQQVRDIQNLIEGVTDETLSSVVSTLASSSLVQDDAGIEALAHLLMLAGKFRAAKIELYATLVVELSKSLTKLKEALRAELTNFDRSRDPGAHYFLYRLVKCGYFDITVIGESYRFNSSRYFLEPLRALYFWFAPELSDYVQEYPVAEPEDDDKTECDKWFFSHKDELSADDWKLLKEQRELGTSSDPLFTIVMNDDLDALQAISDLDVNHTIVPSCYNRFFQLQSHPCLLHVAAFFGSRKCAQYLLEKGAELKTDNSGRPVGLFLAYGGNISMMDMFPDQDYSRLYYVSAAHHHGEVKGPLLEMNHPSMNLKEMHTKLGTALHQVCGTCFMDGVLYCFEQGVNPTDSNQVCSSFTKDKLRFIMLLNMVTMRLSSSC